MGDWGPLGIVLSREPSEQNRANVAKLADRAAGLLREVRDTFPGYTLHDEKHAENVIGLMGRLAAPGIDAMRPLEAALLILAAYFHDSGMAYTAQERDNLGDDEYFQAFLDRNDEAYLATRRNGGTPPPGVITQYYRSRHADRVWHHLEECDPSWLTWDGASIIEPLAVICQSHNEATAELRDERFKKNYRQKADLRFCAIMLRLADILDLDRTRTPQVMYDHLGLARHNTPESAISDAEWQKHLAAGGFEFPAEPERNYTLQFVADPSSPGVEHDLRTFLAVVKEELLQCRSVADLCDERWRSLPLPAEIDTSTITSHGYKYGEFRFELDRPAVLELFTGERLYDDPYAFLRELLQNAFDATNARAHLFGHESAGIQVTCWEDVGGYVWVRVDDDGIGMDEDSLRRYFLRIGKSYYRSAQFEADSARRGRTDRSFGAISKFGIGVLACFMIGDQVEVSSRRQASSGDGALPIRLSINRRDDYFVLQEQDRPTRRGTPLPGRNGPEQAFRRSPGTSIAVRIDPNRATVDLSTALARIESYVFAPPVPVSVNGQPVGRDSSRLVDEPFLPATELRRFPIADLKRRRGDFVPGLRELAVAAIPIDLGRVDACPDVRGQMLAYVPLIPSAPGPVEDSQRVLDACVWRDILLIDDGALIPNSRTVDITVFRSFDRAKIRQAYRTLTGEDPPEPAAQPSDVAPSDQDPADDLGSALRKIVTTDPSPMTIFEIPYTEIPRPDLVGRSRDGRSWAYNGIALPTTTEGGGKMLSTGYETIFRGSIALSGDLRPDLSISRSSIRAVPFPVHSAINFAIRRALHESAENDSTPLSWIEAALRTDYLAIPPGEPSTAASLWADRLIRTGAWNSEVVIGGLNRRWSVDQLRAAAHSGTFANVSGWFHAWDKSKFFSFYTCLTAGLLHFFVDLEWIPPSKATSGALRVRSADSPGHPDGNLHFPPLFAVDYSSEDSLARSGPHLNASHPLTRWLMEHAETLATEFPAPFQRVFRRLATTVDDVAAVNKALDRVAQSRSEMAPPAGAYLREDENGWWWSR